MIQLGFSIFYLLVIKVSKGSWHSQRRGSNAPLDDRIILFAKVICSLQGDLVTAPAGAFRSVTAEGGSCTEKERNAPGYRCIVAPFILKGLDLLWLLVNRESS